MISAECKVLYEIVGKVVSCLVLKGNLIGYVTTRFMGGGGVQKNGETIFLNTTFKGS